jgi:hypothetical protein
MTTSQDRRPTRHARLAPGALVCAVALIAGIGVAVAKPAAPRVEVKFFLKPEVVLDANQQPTRDLLAAFQAAPASRRLHMQFLDGSGRELHQAGWSVRIRRVEGKKELELDYKRRYPVRGKLETTLEQAERAGFGAGENDYKPELEWGLTCQTLTFTNSEEIEGALADAAILPAPARARQLAVREMPGKLKRLAPAGAAARILSAASIYGPVEGRRWSGRHADIDDGIDIEVWAVRAASGTGTEHIVEVSFKKSRLDANAAAKRDALRSLLHEKGWLLERDVLKTSLIMERYGNSPRPSSRAACGAMG